VIFIEDFQVQVLAQFRDRLPRMHNLLTCLAVTLVKLCGSSPQCAEPGSGPNISMAPAFQSPALPMDGESPATYSNANLRAVPVIQRKRPVEFSHTVNHGDARGTAIYSVWALAGRQKAKARRSFAKLKVNRAEFTGNFGSSVQNEWLST
jgi:hypothetical protein